MTKYTCEVLYSDGTREEIRDVHLTIEQVAAIENLRGNEIVSFHAKAVEEK